MYTHLPIPNLKKYNEKKGTEFPYSTAFLGDYNSGGEGTGSHPGVDVAVPVGTPILAIADGTVVKTKKSRIGWGNHIVIEHGDKQTEEVYSCYCHLSVLSVEIGDAVFAGQPIAESGNTGSSSGAHLHFQIDKKTAPFHPYWPFSHKKALQKVLTIFGAINEGMGEENTKLYCENPMVWIQERLPKTSQRFSDVGPTHPFFLGIAELEKLKIIGGYNDGTFRPEKSINRAEFLKLVFSALSIESKTNVHPFSDVIKGSWYESYVAEAYARGWVQGYREKFFHPGNPVSRAEAFKILALAFKVVLPNVKKSAFSDTPLDMWYTVFASWAHEEKLLSFQKNIFDPNRDLSRGESAKVVWMLLEKQKKN